MMKENDMSVNELYSISERLDQLASDAWGFHWSAEQVILHIRELADALRDDADVLAEAIAESAGPYETDLWYDTSKELT
jgi:acyl-CoA reductase-like NAD-dependent aldehyde dehydrogenase